MTCHIKYKHVLDQMHHVGYKILPEQNVLVYFYTSSNCFKFSWIKVETTVGWINQEVFRI